MRRPAFLTIPQPCNENWDAMTPATAGRHCAACAKTVVDFTQQTDAEILAYLASTVSGRTCGRFATGQLERPLQRAALAAPTRWRAWLAAAVAVWGLREVSSPKVRAQTAVEQHKKGEPSVVPSPGYAVRSSDEVPVRTLRGVIWDSTTRNAVPGATVLFKNTDIGASTDAEGRFELPVPANLVGRPVTVRVSSIGYASQERVLVANGEELVVHLAGYNGWLSGEVMITCVRSWPWWHPRSFYSQAKYWLTRPFRKSS